MATLSSQSRPFSLASLVFLVALVPVRALAQFVINDFSAGFNETATEQEMNVDLPSSPSLDERNSLGLPCGVTHEFKSYTATRGRLIQRGDTWTEIIGSEAYCFDLTGLSLKIKVSPQAYSVVQVDYIQKKKHKLDLFTTAHSLNFKVDPVTPEVIAPMAAFLGADPTLGYAFEISSSAPIVLEKIEMVVTPPAHDIDLVTKLHQTKVNHYSFNMPGKFTVSVSADNFYKDAFRRISAVSDVWNLRKLLQVRMTNSKGEVSAGNNREFFTRMSRFLFKPTGNDFFELGGMGHNEVHIKASGSSSATKSAEFYRCIGRIMGMAIFSGYTLDANLSITIYKAILQIPVTLLDVYTLDPPLYNFLESILHAEVDDLHLTMSDKLPQNGHLTTIDLVPQGRYEKVTEDNKQVYVQKLIECRFKISNPHAATNMRQGVLDVVPEDFLNAFTEYELKLIVEGTSEINVEKWRDNTKYDYGYNRSQSGSAQSQHSDTSSNDADSEDSSSLAKCLTIPLAGRTEEQILYDWVQSQFWPYLETLDNDKLRKILEFATGSPRVPLSGYAGMGFTIAPYMRSGHCISGQQPPKAIPSQNQLILPVFSKYDHLKEHLSLITETNMHVVAQPGHMRKLSSGKFSFSGIFRGL